MYGGVAELGAAWPRGLGPAPGGQKPELECPAAILEEGKHKPSAHVTAPSCPAALHIRARDCSSPPPPRSGSILATPPTWLGACPHSPPLNQRGGRAGTWLLGARWLAARAQGPLRHWPVLKRQTPPLPLPSSAPARRRHERGRGLPAPLQAPRAGGRPRHGRPAPALRRHERRRRPPCPRLPRLAARRRLPAARRLPRRPRLRPRHGLRQQPGQPRPPHRGREHRPLHPGEQAEVLLRRGHRLRGPQAGAARLPLRAPGLAGALPAGHADRAPLRRQRPRPLHPRHGLHHLRPHRRPGAGHAEQVFPGHPGAAGQLGPGLADRGGAGHPAEPLPDDGEHRPHHHRPCRLLRLQVRGHDRGRRVRAALRQDGLLPAAELVLRDHLLLHDPHAAPEDPVGGGGRGRAGARGQEPAAHVPHHGHRRAAAALHVLAHLPPRLVSPRPPACPLAPRGLRGSGTMHLSARAGAGVGALGLAGSSCWKRGVGTSGRARPAHGGSSVAPASLLRRCSRCPWVLDTPGPLLLYLLVAAACVTRCYRLRPGLTPPPLPRGLALAPALATSPLPSPPTSVSTEPINAEDSARVCRFPGRTGGWWG